MLDLSKVQAIAQSYSPQELFAALVWQRRFNEFCIFSQLRHPNLTNLGTELHQI
ncbi:MAG: hypothetical protein MUF49_25770 [Oculatellaceae cyanobacterium Prado106]|nr:hypothetical protein [Oculatellaceae cyanobacterium Prado106]